MSSQPYQITIDIGSSHIAIASSEFLSNEEVRVVHASITPSEGVDRGYISDTTRAGDSLKNAIARFEKKSHMTVKRALFSLGGTHLASQYVRTNIELKQSIDISQRDINQVVNKAELLFGEKYPNKKVLHVFPVSYRVDEKDILGSPVGMYGSSLEAKILLITIPEHHFESLVNVAEYAGVAIDDVIAGPLADAAECLNYNQKKQGCVLVNVGAESTQISTYEQGSISSLRVVPLGSSDITNDLALGFTIPIEKAEELKQGKKDSEYPEKRVQEIVGARLADIIESVERHLREIKKNRLLPAGVVWTGAGSQIPGMNEYAKAQLHIPSTTTNLELSSPDGKRKVKVSPKLSTAYGLAKAIIEPTQEATEFSFAELKKKVRYWLSQLKP